MGFRRNVFVLGAGFSNEAGAPLMKDFFAKARELRDDPHSQLSPTDREIFTRVIEYRFGLNRALAKVFVDLDNIEQLFGFLEMDMHLSSSADENLRADMIYVIARTLEVSIADPLPKADHLYTFSRSRSAGSPVVTEVRNKFKESWYRFFAGFVSAVWNPSKVLQGSSKDTVITFNYDLILEREMRHLGVEPDYHCGPSAGPHKRELGVYRSRLDVLKMHGSANWVTCPECRDKLYFLEPDGADVLRVRGEPCPACNHGGLAQLIVPPTWNKGIEGRFIRPVWSAALEALSNAGRLFIIGYSFPETDQFFKYMLGLALAANNQLAEIYVVDPSEEVASKFGQFFNPYFHQRAVQYKQLYAGDFVERIQDYTNQELDAGHLDDNFL